MLLKPLTLSIKDKVVRIWRLLKAHHVNYALQLALDIGAYWVILAILQHVFGLPIQANLLTAAGAYAVITLAKEELRK